ncbi:DUF4136 domain-containing protein [Sphingomonas sp. XXL09]|uniref:DUF4136 domain-containing protein n=1 Tax=Sphingomonas sp. XXL09 TaxID=3457787 RepID=UPI00406BD2CC
MSLRPYLALGAVAAALAGCATTQPLPPTEVIRYHLDRPIARGTIAVQPLDASNASIEFKTYAAAVEGELLKAGYSLPAQGARPDYVATVNFTRTTQEGPPRPSPFSIGIGGGSFSGGRRGGVGLGGGIGFPIGKSRPTNLLVAELAVTIKDARDQSPVWEGRAQGISDIKRADEQAPRLAHALFTGFPGESGRTIEVR